MILQTLSLFFLSVRHSALICLNVTCLSAPSLFVNNFAHHLGQFVLVFLTLAFGALDITSIRTIPGVRFQKKTPVAEGEMEKGAIHCYKGLEIRDNGFNFRFHLSAWNKALVTAMTLLLYLATELDKFKLSF